MAKAGFVGMWLICIFFLHTFPSITDTSLYINSMEKVTSLLRFFSLEEIHLPRPLGITFLFQLEILVFLYIKNVI